mgnify:FL=1
MSSASKTVNIKFMGKSGTYTAMIQCPSGDLYQEYQRNGDQVMVTPDFTKTKPVLNYVCTSSRVAEGLTTPVSMDYYFGETQITFDSSGKSSGLFKGLFEIVNTSASQLYKGLRIVGNLAEAAGFAPITIQMVGHIAQRGGASDKTDDIGAFYAIPIGPYTGTAYRVTIKSPDGSTKGFTLTSAEDSCQLEAQTTQGNETLTSGLYYKWFGASPSDTGWALIAGASSKTLTVKAADVDCTREYKVEVYNDKSMDSDHLLGFDFQTVIDASDPYDIDPCPKPADETIEEDESGNDSVTYTPKLVVRGQTKAIDTKFRFTLKSAAGVVLNTEAARKPTVETNSFKVTRQDCCNGGYSDVALTISSVK